MEKVIMYDDVVVTKETLTVYRNHSGKGFLSEADARDDGCTHEKCPECGEIMEKRGFRSCSVCRDKKDAKEYALLKKIVWDEGAPVYDDERDQWYSSIEELQEAVLDCDCCEKEKGDNEEKFCEECVASINYGSLRLFLGEHRHMRCVSEDYWEDDLREDEELSDKVVDAIDALNDALEGQETSWVVGNTAVKVEV